MTAVSHAKSLSKAQAANESHFFHNLDALRGICALLVALFHSSWPSNFKLLPFIEHGWLFVDFFFILSGFVIANAYLDGNRSLRHVAGFMIRRFFRLYPLHLFAFLVVGLITTYYAQFSWQNLKQFSGPPEAILHTLLLIQTLGKTGPSLNTPSWSISAEFWTYVVFAVVTITLPWRSARALAMSAIGLYSIWVLLTKHSAGIYAMTDLGFYRCLAGFSLGLLVWQGWRLTGHRLPATLVAAALAGLFVLLFASLPYVSTTSPSNCLYLGLFAAIIYFCAVDPGSIVRQALETAPMLLLGRHSYSIYMLHAALLLIVSSQGYHWLRPLQDLPVKSGLPVVAGDVACVVFAALTIAASWLSYKFVEVPWRDFGKRLAKRVITTPSIAAHAVQG